MSGQIEAQVALRLGKESRLLLNGYCLGHQRLPGGVVEEKKISRNGRVYEW
jgi:hypothetical protein